MKTIIIDRDARDIAQRVLAVFPECQVTGTFADWTSGWAAIRAQKPEIVLVSPDPDDFGGLEMLEQLEREHVEVAIVSEWATFAYEAQDCGATFLLKPLKNDVLAKILDRMARRARDHALLRQLILTAVSTDQPPGHKPAERLVLIGRDIIDYVPIKQILRYEIDQSYCQVVLQNGRAIPVTLPLRKLEQQLQQYPFARANRSCIINLQQVERYHRTKKTLVLSDGAHVPLSRSYQANVLQKLGKG